jgi:two-component system cell cycle sensor histidine kinase/response regulator CckA
VRDDDALLASVVDHLPLGVWIARVPGGEFVFANRVFREIMGMEARPDVAAGGYAAPYGIFTRDGEPYPEARMPFMQALRARQTITVDDIAIHRHDGRRVMIHATARPVFDETGTTITHVVIAFEDVSAKVAALAAQERSEERLRQARRLEALGTLAGGVAHDFNNLLASIRVLASLLRASEAHPARRADLARIEEVTESAARLTSALLTFGRHGDRRISKLSLTELARSLAELVRRTFDRRIEVSFEEHAPRGLVSADPSQMEQLIMNLVLNARDAMPDGGQLRIAITDVYLEAPPPPLEPGPHVRLEVIDSGPGVPPALRERIFEPYVTTKTDREEPGAGLGLATVHGVVQAHGGHVEVTDAVPHGACFRVHLPAAPVRTFTTLAPPLVAEGSSDGEDVPTAPRDPGPAGIGTVLVVEDDPLQRRAERRALETLGYDVLEAADGVEAMELFRARAGVLRAVLLDLAMPRLSGREAWAEMRRVAPEVPVLMTTGHSGPDQLDDLRALGAAFLTKPFGVTELSQAMAELIDRIALTRSDR